MDIEITFQSIVIQTDEIQGNLFGLAYEMGRFHSLPKKRKRRKYKKRELIGPMIDRIIDDVEK